MSSFRRIGSPFGMGLFGSLSLSCPKTASHCGPDLNGGQSPCRADMGPRPGLSRAPTQYVAGLLHPFYSLGRALQISLQRWLLRLWPPCRWSPSTRSRNHSLNVVSSYPRLAASWDQVCLPIRASGFAPASFAAPWSDCLTTL